MAGIQTHSDLQVPCAYAHYPTMPLKEKRKQKAMKKKALLLDRSHISLETLSLLRSPHQEIPTIYSCSRCVLTWTF